jgi:glutaredoxin-related protein
VSSIYYNTLVWVEEPEKEKEEPVQMLMSEILGIKEYSEWPTIPQLYVDKEFVGGCDIIVAMHQNGELAKMLEEKKVLVPAEEGTEAK